MELREIEVVEDRTGASRCDEGFLRLARLVLQNRYADGKRSESYPCDVVSRRFVDAVVVVLWALDAEGRVRVVLRECLRPPIYLRRFKTLEHPDDRPYGLLREVVAGLIEADDGGDAAGLLRRAAAEAREEAGFEVAPDDLVPLGGPVFASPGTTDEKLHFVAARVDLGRRGAAAGDGSVMEEVGDVAVVELGEALAACRRGDQPDMKTELALARLADHLGYLPALGCFAADLPAELARRFSPPGLAGGRRT